MQYPLDKERDVPYAVYITSTCSAYRLKVHHKRHKVVTKKPHLSHPNLSSSFSSLHEAYSSLFTMQHLHYFFFCVMWVLLVCTLHATFAQNGELESSASDNLVLPPVKRPFCNRFGGCSAVGRMMGASRKRWGFEEPNGGNQDAFTANLIALDALANDPYRQKMRNYLRP